MSIFPDHLRAKVQAIINSLADRLTGGEIVRRGKFGEEGMCQLCGMPGELWSDLELPNGSTIAFDGPLPAARCIHFLPVGRDGYYRRVVWSHSDRRILWADGKWQEVER